MEGLDVLAFDVGVRNLAFCYLRKDDEAPGYHIKDWDLLDLGMNGASTLEQYVNELCRQLEQLSEAWRAENRHYDVVIEQQLGSAAMGRELPMKAISHCIQTYFFRERKKVTFQHGATKLRAYKGIVPHIPDTPGDSSKSKAKRPKTKYQQAKEMGVLHTSLFLADLGAEEWIEFFALARKNDDLADALLHALAYADDVTGSSQESIRKSSAPEDSFNFIFTMLSEQ